ncbi:MAG: chromate reductase [Bacteroidia bacterium]|jgi:chromate reductase
MSKVIAFGASNSSTSINKQLAAWAANQLDSDIEILDLNDFEMPIYSQDREKADGIHEKAMVFKTSYVLPMV